MPSERERHYHILPDTNEAIYLVIPSFSWVETEDEFKEKQKEEKSEEKSELFLTPDQAFFLFAQQFFQEKLNNYQKELKEIKKILESCDSNYFGNIYLAENTNYLNANWQKLLLEQFLFINELFLWQNIYKIRFEILPNKKIRFIQPKRFSLRRQKEKDQNKINILFLYAEDKLILRNLFPIIKAKEKITKHSFVIKV